MSGSISQGVEHDQEVSTIMASEAECSRAGIPDQILDRPPSSAQRSRIDGNSAKHRYRLNAPTTGSRNTSKTEETYL